MKRITGTYARSTTLGETVQAFVPHPLPPADPALAPDSYVDLNRQAELALARLAGIEGTQATLVDLLDAEPGFTVANTDDVEEVTNHLRAFRRVRDELRDPDGLPISARLLCEAHRLLLDSPSGGPTTYRLFEALPMMPRFTIGSVRLKLATSFPTASSAVKVLEALGTVSEATGQKKSRSYSYAACIDLLTH